MERIPAQLEGQPWHRVRGVPTFTTHKVTRRNAKGELVEFDCDERELYAIARRFNVMEGQGFSPSIIDGHLTRVVDGKTEARPQSEITTFGFEVGHRVEHLDRIEGGKKVRRPYIVADQLYYPDKVAEAKTYPHRSVEFVHAWGIYDPSCLIKETPRLNQLGPMLPVDYERGQVPVSRRGGSPVAVPVTCYSLGAERTYYSLRGDTMNPQTKAALEQIAQLITQALAGETGGGAAATLPGAGAGTGAGVGDRSTYSVERHLVDTQIELAQAKQQLEDATKQNKISQRRTKVEALAVTHLVDPEQFLTKFGTLDDAHFENMLEEVKTNYSLRDGVGRQVPPIDAPGGKKGAGVMREAVAALQRGLDNNKRLDLHTIIKQMEAGTWKE